jgi:hypothetical protein
MLAVGWDEFIGRPDAVEVAGALGGGVAAKVLAGALASEVEDAVGEVVKTDWSGRSVALCELNASKTSAMSTRTNRINPVMTKGVDPILRFRIPPAYVDWPADSVCRDRDGKQCNGV